MYDLYGLYSLHSSLGARHDGESDNTRCSAADNFIMTPQSTGEEEVLKNFYRFSPCTIKDFKRTLGLVELGGGYGGDIYNYLPLE